MNPKKRLLLIVLCVITVVAWFATGQMRANVRLRMALKNQDDDAIRAAIASGADPYARRAISFPKSMVWSAMMSMNEKAALPLLLPNGLDLKKLGDDAKEPFGNACSHGDTEVARLFFEAGMSANIDDRANPVGKSGREPSLLMHAAQHGQLEMVRLLLKHSANVNFQHREGPSLEGTPLIAAAKGRLYSLIATGSRIVLSDKKRADLQKTQNQILPLLLEAGADPTVKDSRGRDALFYLREMKNSEGAKLLTDWLSRKKK